VTKRKGLRQKRISLDAHNSASGSVNSWLVTDLYTVPGLCRELECTVECDAQTLRRLLWMTIVLDCGDVQPCLMENRARVAPNH